MKRKIFYVLLAFIVVSYVNVFAADPKLNCSNVLQYGSKGSEVVKLQRLLNSQTNCNLVVDGDFGSLTRACVNQYQYENNIVQSGKSDYYTCKTLNGERSPITYYGPYSYKRAIVKVNNSKIRSGPSTSYSVITTLGIGREVLILGRINDWYKVYNNGTIGYMNVVLVAQDCILIDISDQELNFYSNGDKLWKTRVVTGNVPNHNTPTGAFTLRYSSKQMHRTLRGTNDDGTPYAAYVDYWMPFVGKVGLHDAHWRTIQQFESGSTYLGNGSHGCVNMYNKAAKLLYESVTHDWTVVVKQ